MFSAFTNPKIVALATLLSGLFTKYVFNDFSYAGFLMIAIIIDTATGFWAAAKSNKIQSKPMRQQFCDKVLQYAIMLIIVHVMANHLVDGQPNKVFLTIVPYFKSFMYMIFICAEAFSVDENLGKMGKAFLPKFIRRRMQEFDENGNIPNLKDLTNASETKK